MDLYSNRTSQDRSPRQRGFTLIELLVVVAIVAVLVSLLLPTLNRTAELMKLLTCQNNMRQISTGILLYAGSNNNCYPFSSVNALPEDWVYWSAWRNIEAGGIAPYIGPRFDKRIYTCPGDDLTTHPGYPNEYPFSYSVNINICGYWPGGDNAPPQIPTIYLRQVRHPSNCILIVEETEETLDDGCWAWQGSYGAGRNVMSARHDQFNRELANDPSNVTAGRGNCCFCDGHTGFVGRKDSWNPIYWNPYQ